MNGLSRRSITIRAANPDDAAGIARVHVESWRTTYRGIVPSEYLERMSPERRERFWGSVIAQADSPALVYVAASPSGEVLGFAYGGTEREGNASYTGELLAIYLLEQQQRLGVGRRLFASVVEELLRHGHASMLVRVLRDNPSRGFYERLGGQYVAEKPIDIGGTELIEVAYGWSDLRTLSEQVARWAE